LYNNYKGKLIINSEPSALMECQYRHRKFGDLNFAFMILKILSINFDNAYKKTNERDENPVLSSEWIQVLSEW
jgi:hypothetical protein